MEKRTMGALMAALRKSKGMTQQDVADKLGVSNKTVSKWECDDGYPDISALPAIAQLYGITVDELLRGEVKNEEKEEYKTAHKEKVVRHLLNKGKHKYTNMSVLSLVLFLLSASVTAVAMKYVLSITQLIVITIVSLLFVAAGAVIQYIAVSHFTFTLKDEELIADEEKSSCYSSIKWWLFANLSVASLAVLLFIFEILYATNYTIPSLNAFLIAYIFICIAILLIITFVFKKRFDSNMSDEFLKKHIKKYIIGFAVVFASVTLSIYGCFVLNNELSYEKFQLQSKEQITQFEEFLDGEKYIALDEIFEDGENVYKSFPYYYDKELALTVVDHYGFSTEDVIEGYKHYICESVIRGRYYSDEKFGGEIYFTTIIFTAKEQKEAFIKHYCVKDSSFLSTLKLAGVQGSFEIKYTGKDGLTLKYRNFYVDMNDSFYFSVAIGFASSLVYSIIFFVSLQRKNRKKKLIDE